MYKILNQLHEIAGVSGVLPNPKQPEEESDFENEDQTGKIEIFRMDDTESDNDSDCGCGGDDAESCECDESEPDPIEDIVNKFRDFIQQNVELADDDASDGLDTDDDPSTVTDDELDNMDATEDELDVSDELEAVENEGPIDPDPSAAPEDLSSPDEPIEDPMTEPEPDMDNPDDIEEPNRQGTIRVVKGAHLVYKRKTPDGFYEELWFYNIGKEATRDEMELRKDIISGTDISPTGTQSEDGSQSYEVWTSGNGQMMKIVGLPN